jgi:hypothetical protein
MWHIIIRNTIAYQQSKPVDDFDLLSWSLSGSVVIQSANAMNRRVGLAID